MENINKIENYSEYLEKKKNKDLNIVLDAARTCSYLAGDRYLYHNCLLSQGMTLEQIGICEGVSKQAINEYLKKDKRSQSDRILDALKFRPMYGLELADALCREVGFLYPILNRLEKKGFIESFWDENEKKKRNGARRKYYKIL